MKEQVKDYELSDFDFPSVYCGTYKKYNEGSIYGMWIDLEQFTDANEFFDVCKTLHDDEDSPEFMFQDFQGFPNEFYHESMNEDDIQMILDYIQLDEEDKEMIDAYIECFGGKITDFEELLEKASDAFRGQWNDFRDFADNMAEEEIACHSNGATTEFFERYFDYDAYARDLEYDYTISESGYVFSNY